MSGHRPRVAVVTGAASGIGAACVERLTGHVEHLVLVDRTAAPLEAAAERLTESATTGHPVVADLTDPGAGEQVAAAVTALGTLRSVAHVAGISPTMGDWRSIVDVDLVATARLVGALRPLAVAGTAVVCVASMAAHLLAPYADPAIDVVLDDPLAPTFVDDYRHAAGDGGQDPGLAYALAKRGVIRLVQREALSFGAVGARICSVSPGTTDTPMGRQELAGQPAMATLADLTPLQRTGRPDEIAAAIAFLLSDDAGYITGVDLLVDGGTVAGVAAPSR